MAKHRFAAIQMASGPMLAANLEGAARLIAKAARGGAELVVLPESFALISDTGGTRDTGQRPDSGVSVPSGAPAQSVDLRRRGAACL